MRTVNKVGGTNGTTYTEFYGNTTDVKPTEDVPNGSAFYEVDNNMQEYRFDKENKIWYPITRGGTTPSGDYLPLSGGIMTGDINMDGNSLLNAKSITLKDETGEYTVKMDLVNLGAVKPETGEPFFYEAIEFADPNDNNKLFVISGVADPLLETDAVNLRYLGENYIPLTGTKENKPVTGSIVVSSVNEQVMSVILVNDNTDINKVTSETTIANNNISIDGYNYVGFKVLGSSQGVNDISFYSVDKNDKHDGIHIVYNTEYKYLSFDKYTEDEVLLPVLMRGADTPVEDNDIPNKKYVDDSISTLTTTIGDNYIPLTGTADEKPVSGSIVLGENGSINAGNIIFNQNIIQVFPNLKGSEWRSDFVNGGINYFWNNNYIAHLRPLQIDSIGFSTITAGSIRFSNIGMPIATTDAANKAYVDQETAKYLPLTGTVTDKPVTGDIVFDGTHTVTGVKEPENDTDVVTKKYADDIKTELDDKTNQINEDLSDLSSNINAIRFMSKSVKRFITCCACFEKYLYIFYNNANGSFCDKYDVSIDYIPNLVNTLKLTDENLACSDAKIANDYLYVTLRDGQGGTNTTDGKTLGELHIISLNSFQNVKTLTMNWKCTALTIHKDYLLISMQLAGYDLYDLTNPIEPTLTYSFHPEIGSVEYQECAFFERDNKTYFIDAGFGFGFYIWDVTSKTSPVRVGTFMFSQAWNNGDNLHLHTEGIVIDGNMVYATLSVSEKYIDTEYDKRGIIKFDISNLDVFNYEHMNEIPYEHILINKTDYSPFYGDYDVKPTRIVKVGNALVTNSGAKGLACFKIGKNSVKYNGLISVSDTSLIDRICVTSDGRIFGTNAYNTKLSGKDMVMIRLVNVNFN